MITWAEKKVEITCNAEPSKSPYSGYDVSNRFERTPRPDLAHTKECWNSGTPCMKCPDAYVSQEVFAGKMFHCREFVAIPMRQIKNREFRELYKLFETVTDNAHTDLDTVVIYLLKAENPDSDPDDVEMLWTCSHFEEQDTTYIIGLAHFMSELERRTGRQALLEVIDTWAEKLMITIDKVPIKYPKTEEEQRTIKIEDE